MRPPYEQSGTEIAFWSLFGLFALGEYAMRIRSRLNKSGDQVERWSFLAVIVSVMLGVLGAFGLATWSPAEISVGRLGFFVAGLCLMAAGITVRQWAILALGRFFTADVRVHPGQKVVTTGPYRVVRHPSYSGLILFFIGLGLALDNWASLAILAVLPTAGLVVRVLSEEKALLAGLGEEYREFASTRNRLVPGLW